MVEYDGCLKQGWRCLSKHYIDIWEHDSTIIDQKITMSPRVNEKLWQNENLQIIYARNLNYSIYWWKKCQLIKIFKINGFKLYQIYICWNIPFCGEFKKPEIFCCWCVLELVVLYEGMINIVILPYLSRLLVLIQNVDELSSRLAGWLTDWLTLWHITLHLQSLQNLLAISWEKFN